MSVVQPYYDKPGFRAPVESAAFAPIDRSDGDPRKTRTSGLRFRKPPLYPAELWGRPGTRFRQTSAPFAWILPDRVADGVKIAVLNRPCGRLSSGVRRFFRRSKRATRP